MADSRAPWPVVDGVLLLDKPTGISSNAALQRARRALGAAKAGHAGTLDPLASGLLPVLLGEATKFGGELLAADKAYVATLALGVTTTTGDAEGEVLERRPFAATRAEVEGVVATFLGVIEQVPPMYSALKHAGRPLYAYARAGESVPRVPRPVVVHALRVDALAGDRLTLSVRCSKGTYVRTLAEEIGRALGCGASLTALRRIGVGSFGVAEALPLEALERLDRAAARALVRPTDALLAHLPAIDLGPEAARRLAQGQIVEVGCGGAAAGPVRLYSPGRTFVGTGELSLPAGRLRARRLVRQRGAAVEATPAEL